MIAFVFFSPSYLKCRSDDHHGWYRTPISKTVPLKTNNHNIILVLRGEKCVYQAIISSVISWSWYHNYLCCLPRSESGRWLSLLTNYGRTPSHQLLVQQPNEDYAKTFTGFCKFACVQKKTKLKICVQIVYIMNFEHRYITCLTNQISVLIVLCTVKHKTKRIMLKYHHYGAMGVFESLVGMLKRNYCLNKLYSSRYNYFK